MSATGRGDRLGGAEDNFPSQEWMVHRLLDRVYLPRGRWLEPCAGGGAIIRAVSTHKSTQKLITWDALELREEAREPLRRSLLLTDDAGTRLCACRSAEVGVNFINVAPARFDDVQVVITNPPYAIAEEFIRHCLLVAPNAWVVHLLRLNFLAGDERSKWQELHMPDGHVLPNRPSFRAKGTDSCEYAWMIWAPGAGITERDYGIVRLLDRTPLEVRQRDKAAALAWEGIS